MREYSKYQNDVFNFITHGRGHAIIEAVAGSGKTSTIEEALKRISPVSQVLVLAFNKHIATELQKRVPTHVEASTFNSFGFKIVKRNLPKVVLNQYKTDDILKKMCADQKTYFKHKALISRLVSLFKSVESKDIEELASKYDLQLPTDTGFEPLFRQVFEACMANKSIIDFDDQIYYPIAFDWHIP